MKVAVGNDHRGALVRRVLIDHLQNLGHEVMDLGAEGATRVDYPDYAEKVARCIAAGEADLGVLICGTGIGMSIAANKIDGVRCAVCTDAYGAEMARRHNDANIVALRAVEMDPERNVAILDAFLHTPFEGGRHQLRVSKIRDLERI